MKLFNRTTLGGAAIISLLLCLLAGFTSCGSSDDFVYTFDDGRQVKGVKFRAADGKNYYAVLVDSVNLQEALALQKEGWMLPRALGASVMSEHRHTSMPTFESLTGWKGINIDADFESNDQNNRFFEMDESLKKVLEYRHPELGDTPFCERTAFWSSTRYLVKDSYANYALYKNRDSKGTELYSTLGGRAAHLRITAMLVKPADYKAVDEDTYLSADGEALKATAKIQGRDGYEYYILNMPGMFTWEEAIALERDGWLLPRTEGKYHPNSKWPEKKMEEWTLHSNSYEPTIEGISGDHPLINFEEDCNKEFFNAFGTGVFWLGTPGSKTQSFTLLLKPFPGYNGHPTVTMGNISYDEHPMPRMVCLVKRVPSKQPAVKYQSIDGDWVHAVRVESPGGNVYQVVDPTGWRNRTIGRQHIRKIVAELEHDGWHLPTMDELAELFGSDRPFVLKTKYDHIESPLLNTLFGLDVEKHIDYLVRNDNDDLTLMRLVMHGTPHRDASGRYYEEKVPRIAFWEKPDGPVAIRLIRTEKEEPATSGKETVKVTSTDKDLAMYGLKGNVKSINGKLLNATQTGEDRYFTTSTVEGSEYTLSFNREGRLTRDQYENICKYDKEGNFIRGNHDYTTLERNSNGQIVSYIDEEPADNADNFTVRYTYTASGQMATLNYSGWSGNFDESYTYNDRQEMTSRHLSQTYEGGGSREITDTYVIRQTDEQGNWTKRLVKRVTEIDDEEYDAATDDVKEVTRREESLLLEEREISYF